MLLQLEDELFFNTHLLFKMHPDLQRFATVCIDCKFPQTDLVLLARTEYAFGVKKAQMPG